MTEKKRPEETEKDHKEPDPVNPDHGLADPLADTNANERTDDDEQ